jgi:hypothetical protein
VNEFVIEVPFSLLAATNENASYLHGIGGYAAVAVNMSASFVTAGDIAGTQSLVGRAVQVYYASAWHSYTIVTTAYDSGTGMTTVTVNASTLPVGGGRFVIDTPGDDSSSYVGDYFANGYYTSAVAVENSVPLTQTIYVRGDATQFLRIGDTVTLTFSDRVATYTVVTINAYDSVNRNTLVVVDRADLIGNASGLISRNIEAVDGVAQAHDVRVYLTGNGLLDVATYYIDKLLRAAGVRLRVELV